MFRVLHTADLHFSMKPEKLQEVVRTTDFILQWATDNRPDCIVIAGDLLDHHDMKIGADSACFRAAKRFVHIAADIAPVVIVRGTLSHDRDISGLFDDMNSSFQVHVSSDVDMVALAPNAVSGAPEFWPADSMHLDGGSPLCAFTLVPSLDKAALLGRIGGDSIKHGNFQFREAVHDMFSGFGLINSQMQCPTVLVTHGMLTGAVFSTGQQAVGEDLEFSLNDLQAAKCDAVMLGHVHKFQEWGNVAYSGSPGRYKLGEQEDKGFLVWAFDGKNAKHEFVHTPARKEVIGNLTEWSDANNVYNEAICLARDCQGTYVRFRYVIAEEDRHTVDRGHLELLFDGAASVKIETIVLTQERRRCEGMSQEPDLPAKYKRWSSSTNTELSIEDVLLSSVIEGKDAEELLQEAMAVVAGAVVVPVSNVPEQADLFAEAA